MAEARPRLVEAPPPPEPERDIPRGGVGPWVVVLLVVLLLAAAIGAIQQASRASAFAAELAATRAELSGTRAALRAHERQLEDVRTAVAQLQELVSRDPLAPAPR